MSTQNVRLESVFCDSSQQVWYLKVWTLPEEVLRRPSSRCADGASEGLVGRSQARSVGQNKYISRFNKQTPHVSTSRHHMCQQVDITYVNNTWLIDINEGHIDHYIVHLRFHYHIQSCSLKIHHCFTYKNGE